MYKPRDVKDSRPLPVAQRRTWRRCSLKKLTLGHDPLRSVASGLSSIPVPLCLGDSHVSRLSMFLSLILCDPKDVEKEELASWVSMVAGGPYLFP